MGQKLQQGLESEARIALEPANLSLDPPETLDRAARETASEAGGPSRLVLDDGTTLPVGRTKVAGLRGETRLMRKM